MLDTDHLPETTTTYAEAARIGEVLLRAVAAMSAMGHDSPATTTIYIDPRSDPAVGFVRDVFLASKFDDHADTQVVDARARIFQYVDEAGWLDVISDAVTR